jgi:hypothetical protein
MEGLRCLQEGDDCRGPVDYHITPDRDDFKAFPRCEHHFQLRLESAQRNREYLSPVPPKWFDPTYAGERWDED